MFNDGSETADIRLEEREGYLYAYVSGPRDSLHVSLDFWQRCITEAEKRSSGKLLVEENFPNQLNTNEIFELAAAIPAIISTELRIAFVDNESEHDDLNMFAETVANNRGVIGRIFNSVENAEAWLNSEWPT